MGSNALHLDSTEDSFLTKYSGILPFDGGAIVDSSHGGNKKWLVWELTGNVYMVGELRPRYVYVWIMIKIVLEIRDSVTSLSHT